MSPQIHHSSSSSLAPPLPTQRPTRNSSSSPVVNGATTTPPPPSSQTQQQTNSNSNGSNNTGALNGPIAGGNGPISASALTSASLSHLEQTRALCKIRRFFGSLIQFGQEAHPEASDRIRALVLSLASGGISIDEFRITLQEATNYPFRSYVIPFLKSHLPLLQREITTLARANNQTTLQYVTTNDTCAMEFTQGPPDHPDIFLPIETGPSPLALNGSAGNGGNSNTSNGGLSGLVFKRRPSDTLLDHPHNGGGSIQDWNDYIYPPTAKRHYAGEAGRPSGGTVPGGGNAGGGGGSSNNTSNPGHGPTTHIGSTNPTVNSIFSSQHSSLFEYQHAAAAAAAAVNSFQRSVAENESFGALLDKSSSHRITDERDLRIGGGGSSLSGSGGLGGIGSLTESQRIAANRLNSSGGGSVVGNSVGGGNSSGEDEWKNIHTMLNCISAMVDKTKRAITILQQRGVDPQQSNTLMSGNSGGSINNNYSAEIAAEIRRQTEEKVAELKRNAEEAVNQVKRQAVVEIQRAVAAAESRAADIMAQERLKMEKFFVDMTRHTGDNRDVENKSPSITTGQSACWNCGRKANETCSGCNMARYCGAFCQHKDWEHHHQICGNTRSDVTTAGCPPKHSSAVAVAAAAAAAVAAVRQGQIARSPPVVTNRDRDVTTTVTQNSVSASGDRNAVVNSTQSASNNSIQNGVNSGSGSTGSIGGSK
ncbi:protein CBFA2T1 isoform X2 [Condylostylus longicornis]|nr:protein CBFA2T1 isoform X2 [Condylostylus longicornis]